MKNNNIFLFIRGLFMTLSLIGFLYQLVELLALYMSTTSRVEISFVRLEFTEMPAITVCLPSFVSMKRFANYLMESSTDLENKQLAEDYMKFREEFIDWNDHAKSKQKEIYDQMLANFLSMNISLSDIFEKISIEELAIINYNALAINKSDNLVSLPKPTTFRSLVPFSDPRICFTYFSEIDLNYIQGKVIKLVTLEMKFKVNKHDFPLDQYEHGDFKIAVHAPDLLPRYIREESFLGLKMGRKNSISCSENRAINLPYPYDTACKWFDIYGNPSAEMRSDCIDKCINEGILQQFPEINCIFIDDNYRLLRENNLGHFHNLSLCNFHTFSHNLKIGLLNKQYLLDHECHQKCARDCIERYFTSSVEAMKEDSTISNDEFSLFLQHYTLPDELIEHKPQMSLIELVSNFGGLLGMWLGINVSMIVNYMLNYIYLKMTEKPELSIRRRNFLYKSYCEFRPELYQSSRNYLRY